MNRWRERIKQMESDPEKYKNLLEKSRFAHPVKKGHDYLPRYRQSIEKSQVEETKKLLECGVDYRNISKTLGIPMSNVMKIKKAILTNTIDEIVDDTAEKIKENVLMKKNALIESEEDEIRRKPRRKKRKIINDEIKSEKIQLRKRKIQVDIKEERDCLSENYSDDDWSSDGSSENFESENRDYEDWNEPSGYNYGNKITIKDEKDDENYGHDFKVEDEDNEGKNHSNGYYLI